MAVWALGINHTTAPLDMRGRFAFALDQIGPTLEALRQDFDSRLGRRPEAAILSTCNRTEIYCAGQRHEIESTVDWLAQSGGVAPAATPTCCRTPAWPVMPSGWPAASIPWCWARRRSSAS